MDRVFGVLGSDVEKMKLAASIYLTLPGIPFLYYGEEIGMVGSGDDPSKRRPMQWADQADGGFSNVTPWSSLGTNYHTNNVEDMNADPSSLLQHYRKLIRIRNEQEALRRGQTLMVSDQVDNVFSFARVLDHEAVLVAVNTSAQPADPIFSLEISALAPGEYFVTELLTQQSAGKITIDDHGGFAGWHSNENSLSIRTAWILSLSAENPITAIAEPGSIGKLRLTPNPATDSFQIMLAQNADANTQLRVFTSSGKLYFEGKMQGNKMDVRTSDWPDGIYFVQLSTVNAFKIGKLVIARK